MSRDSLKGLEQMVDRIEEATEGCDEVSLETILDAVGRRSFGPLLLVAGLIALSPLSGIPGMPTTIAVLIGLIAAQLLLNKEQLWLPQWLLRRQVSGRKLATALSWGRPAARFIDRFVHQRLTWLTGHAGMYLAAVLCIFIAATMPPLELLPFAASIAGGAVAAFGLALMAEDGVVGLLALALTAGAGALLIYQFLG